MVERFQARLVIGNVNNQYSREIAKYIYIYIKFVLVIYTLGTKIQNIEGLFLK